MAVVGEAQIVVRAVTTGFRQQVQAALAGINAQQSGQSVGRTFSRGFSRGASQPLSGINKTLAEVSANGRGAADAFRRLVTAGYFIGPAIAVAVGAIGALAQGLVILVSQVSAAVPALVVLPGIFAAVAQGALVLKAAFSGIGAGLKALNKQATGGSRDNTAALRRIQDAERALSRVIEENRETLVRSARDLKDAEDELTKARKEAREELQQLQFDAEDAAISEKKAALELERARETLARVQDLPPNSRARREAELAYAEADLNLRRAKDRNSDLAKETDEQTKAGIEGSEKVVAATRRVQDAQEQYDKDVRDGLRKQTDAERELARAKEDATKGGGGGGGTSDFDNLGDSAKRFVLFLKNEIIPQFKELKTIAQDELFPPLEVAIRRLTTSYMPLLRDIVRDTARAAGLAANDFANLAMKAMTLQSFKRVGETNAYIVERTGKIVGNLYVVVLRLLDAAGPLIRRFTDWVATLTEGLTATLDTNEELDKMTGIFNYAGDVAAQLGRIFGNIAGALMNIGRAAAGPGSAGEMLLTSFENATQKFEEWSARVSGDGSLEAYFKRVVPNIEAIGRLVVELGKAFGTVADDKSVADFVDSLSRVTQSFADALTRLIGGAPALGEFIEKFGKFIALFAESQSVQNFFSVLNVALDVMIKIFSNDMIAKITMNVVSMLAFVKALTLLKNVGMFGITVLTGYGQKFMDLLKFIPGVSGLMANLTGALKIASVQYKIAGGGLSGIRVALSGLAVTAGPVLAVVAAVVALVAIFVAAYKQSQSLREEVAQLVFMIKDALGDAFQIIKQAINDALPTFEGIGGVFKKIGDVLAVTLLPLLQVLIPGAIRVVATAIGGLIRIAGGIYEAFKAQFQFLGAIFKLFKGDWDGFLNGMKNSAASFISAIKGIFRGLFDVFRVILNPIIQLWNSTVAGFKFTVPGWIPLVGGKSFSIPKIPSATVNLPTEFTGGGGGAPRMALGGTVYPSMGGTLVRVAEAGRPERIEPLDRSGLSQRDRAIISQLAGTSGQTFNVYPSPGMDEAELAALISRQIAFQLRAGAV